MIATESCESLNELWNSLVGRDAKSLFVSGYSVLWTSVELVGCDAKVTNSLTLETLGSGVRNDS